MWQRSRSGLLTPGHRGHRGHGGGEHPYLTIPPTRRAATEVVKGIYPWMTGGGAPRQGVIVGKAIVDGETTGINVCCDPLTWFKPANIILNPSAFILGRPGFGKSTLIRRWIAVLASWGVVPFVLGDVKGEYVKLVLALGGQVISPGRGGDKINPLDIREAAAAARLIGGEAGAQLLADAKARRLIFVESLVTLHRGEAPTGDEGLLLDLALGILDKLFARRSKPPVLPDLDKVFADAPEELREATLWRDSWDRYFAATDQIRKTLKALVQGSSLGDVFSGQTTTPIRRDVGLCFNLSRVSKDDAKLRAALQLASWATGFGSIAISHALSAAGHGIYPDNPYRITRYFAVMDELWSALREGPGLAGKVDSLGRLNRSDEYALAEVMCSHSMDDTEKLNADDRAIARGLVERAGYQACFSVPGSEWPRLRTIGRWTDEEEATNSAWSGSASWDALDDDPTRPPEGLGKVMFKVPGRDAVAAQIRLAPSEVALSDTNAAWVEATAA